MPAKSWPANAASDREAQDAYALESHRKAAAATAAGRFAAEILPVTIPQKKGDADRVRARRIDPPRDDDRGAACAGAGVPQRRHGHGWQRAAGQRRRGRAGRDLGGTRDRARR